MLIPALNYHPSLSPRKELHSVFFFQRQRVSEGARRGNAPLCSLVDRQREGRERENMRHRLPQRRKQHVPRVLSVDR